MIKRFKGKMSEEYGLIALAAPHYVDCQKKLGAVIKKYFSRRKGKKFDVLEIGCGSGVTSEIILKADKRIRIFAVDNEPEMIRQIKRKLANYVKSGRIKIIKTDALDFAKKSKSAEFDAFASALTIHNFKNKYRKQFLAEVFRLLKSEGLFINMDRYAHDNPKIFERWVDWQIGMYENIFPRLGEPELVKQWIAHEKYDSRPDVIMKMKSALADMKKAGFKNIKFTYRKKTYSILTARR